MQYDAGENTQPMVESTQMADTFIRAMIDHTITARLLSMRCQEAQEQSLPNQDFAQILCRDGSSLCFCVCDGVGSSYKGDFAAYYLATCLMEWLQGLTGLQQEPAMLAAILQTHLNQRARQAQEELKRVGPPPGRLFWCGRCLKNCATPTEARRSFCAAGLTMVGGLSSWVSRRLCARSFAGWAMLQPDSFLPQTSLLNWGGKMKMGVAGPRCMDAVVQSRPGAWRLPLLIVWLSIPMALTLLESRWLLLAMRSGRRRRSGCVNNPKVMI